MNNADSNQVNRVSDLETEVTGSLLVSGLISAPISQVQFLYKITTKILQLKAVVSNEM